MHQKDWTPAVLVTASLSLTVVLTVLLTSPIVPSPFEAAPGPGHARRRLPPDLEVWVGEVAPGLVGVLAPVWGQPGPDREHDARLGEALALPGGEVLGWYQLLVFNTGTEPRALPLAGGALEIRPPTGGFVPQTSLPALVARGEAVVPPGVAAVLRAHGALEADVSIPPGTMADLLVAFAHHVDLAEAQAVTTAAGRPLQRRRMSRSELEGLVADPRLDRIQEL